MDVDFVRGVERFEEKVLFLAGSCNTITGEAQQRLHLKSFRKAELVVIVGSGHRMFSEKPRERPAAVRRYFDEPAGSGGPGHARRPGEPLSAPRGLAERTGGRELSASRG